MTFMGKLFYLTVFPGFIFILFSGTLIRGIKGTVPGLSYGRESAFPASSLRALCRLLTGETIAVGGSLHAVLWIGPAVKIFSLSWITCIIFGYMQGDVFLLILLLLSFSSVDLLICWLSGSSRVRRECPRAAASIIGWALPLSLVLTAIALRVSDPTIAGIMRWQVAYGSLLFSREGGVLAQAGSIISLPVAFFCLLSLTGMKPFGYRAFSYGPGDISGNCSGVPLALLCSAETCGLFVMPLLLVALFFAGPASTWLEVLFWVLKVAGVFVLMLLLNYLTHRVTGRSVLYLMCGLGGILALIAFVLIWFGVGA